MATALGNSVPRNPSPQIDGIIQGGRWSGSTLTYSFWDTNGATWTAFGKSTMRLALSAISSSVNLQFQEVAPGGTVFNNASDMSFAFMAAAARSSGFAALGMSPDPDAMTRLLVESGSNRAEYPTVEGDVWLNPYSGAFSTTNAKPGGVGFEALLHEIGHTLGLKHPHDDGGNGRPTYSALGVSGYDNSQYTVMSYNSVSSIDAWGHANTLSYYDIAALQSIYGANPTTGTGNNVYSITSSFSSPQTTIWDVGGDDRIDAQSMRIDVTIDLREGAKSGTLTLPTFNDSFVIGPGVVIENATGGLGSDRITGNAVANQLVGGLGYDTLTGGAGDDTLDGGDGTDIAVFGQASSAYRLLSTAQGTVLAGADGYDTLIGIETLQFGDGSSVALSSMTATAFDPLTYLASNRDLIAAFGTNTSAAKRHFSDYGIREGRSASFDGASYLAANTDLLAAFHTDVAAATLHYVQFGWAENRARTFNTTAYLAANPDVARATGGNAALAVAHYITFGWAERRPTAPTTTRRGAPDQPDTPVTDQATVLPAAPTTAPVTAVPTDAFQSALPSGWDAALPTMSASALLQTADTGDHSSTCLCPLCLNLPIPLTDWTTGQTTANRLTGVMASDPSQALLNGSSDALTAGFFSAG